jgi:hypothetical protein
MKKVIYIPLYSFDRLKLSEDRTTNDSPISNGYYYEKNSYFFSPPECSLLSLFFFFFFCFLFH